MTKIVGDNVVDKSDMDSARNSLKSVGIGKLLKHILWVRLGLAIASGFISLIEFTVPSIYQVFSLFDGIISAGSILVGISSLILLWTWLHRLHADLKVLFQNYPIKPWGAVARFLIPVYSLWGMADTINTFADRLKPEGGDLTDLSTQIRSLIPPVYAFILTTSVWNRVISQASNKSPEGESLAWMFLVAAVLEVGTAYVLIALTKTMQTAAIQKSKRAIA
jgi:hypothetical protein